LLSGQAYRRQWDRLHWLGLGNFDDCGKLEHARERCEDRRIAPDRIPRAQ
jgi:hypothetical protein